MPTLLHSLPNSSNHASSREVGRGTMFSTRFSVRVPSVWFAKETDESTLESNFILNM